MEPGSTAGPHSSSSSDGGSGTSSGSTSSTSSSDAGAGGNLWQRPATQRPERAASTDVSSASWGLPVKLTPGGGQGSGEGDGRAAVTGREGHEAWMGSGDGKSCPETLYIQMEFCPRTLKVTPTGFAAHVRMSSHHAFS